MTSSTFDVAVCCSKQLGEFARALLLRLEQPRVLDRDHRLVGEGGDQLDLLFSEGLNSCLPERKHANGNTLAQQRHTQHRAIVCDKLVARHRVFGIGRSIHAREPCVVRAERVHCMMIRVGTNGFSLANLLKSSSALLAPM